MEKGKEGEGLLLYRNPKMEHGNRARYTKFMLDPAAGVDSRVGKKKLEADSFNSWADVYDALKYWAKQA
ncbi:MAG: DUF3313 domain-containing protein, partial [Nitrospirota bacterium]|nr:DUF3313 domain-containing protein [Nitrospirota bacterium]